MIWYVVLQATVFPLFVIYWLFFPVLGLKIRRLGFWGRRPYAKLHQNGKNLPRIVLEQACDVSRRYHFPPLKNR